MKIRLARPDPKPVFDVPEGNFAAELVNVGPYEQETATGVNDTIRFTFRVQVPGMEKQIVMAGKNIDPESSKLPRFLTKWLGKDFISTAGDSFDPETLIAALDQPIHRLLADVQQ